MSILINQELIYRDDLRNPTTPRQYPTSSVKRRASIRCTRVQVSRASFNTLSSSVFDPEHLSMTSECAFRNTAIQALTSSKSIFDRSRLDSAHTKAESSDCPSRTCGLRDLISTSTFAGGRLFRCSIKDSKSPDKDADFNSVTKEDSEEYILAILDRSVTVLSVTRSRSTLVSLSKTSCAAGRKKGAFCGALGGSTGLLRSLCRRQ